MAPETFDFSSFSLRSLRVSDFLKKTYIIVFLWTSRLQASHLLGRKECEVSSFPRCQAGQLRLRKLNILDVSFPERNLLHN